MKKITSTFYLILLLLSGVPIFGFSQGMPVPVDLGPDTTICRNVSLTLDATFPNCTYLWSTGATTATIVASNIPGTFSVTVTDTTGTYTPGTDAITISGLNIPPVSITPSGIDTACFGDSIRLGGSFGGTSQWYRNGVAIPGPHTNEYWVTQPGSYNMTKTNLNGCTDSASAATVVNFIDPPISAWSADKDTVDLTVSGDVNFTDMSSDATSWMWNFGDGGTSTDQNPMHTYTTAGTYTVTQTAINRGCETVDSAQIVVEGVLSLDPMLNAKKVAELYPNPAQNVLHIEVLGNERLEMEFFSLRGLSQVKQLVYPGVQAVSISELATGLYFYRLYQQGTVVQHGKLIRN